MKRGRYSVIANSKDGVCKLELVDNKPPDRVCFINEDSPKATKFADPDMKQAKPVPLRKTYGPASNGQIPSESEIMQSLRSKGYSSLKDIDAVMLETNGDILVYKQSRNERYLFNPTRCQDGLNTLQRNY